MKTKIEGILVSGPIETVEVFNVNDSYFEIEDQDLWIIDGAIQFKLPSGNLQIGWSEEYSMFLPSKLDIKATSSDLIFKELTKGSIPKLHNLSGKKIENHSCTWVSFEVWDDGADDFVEKHVLVELLLLFDSKETLQIATVDYQLLDGDTPTNFIFDPMAALLISLNTKVDIPPLK